MRNLTGNIFTRKTKNKCW